MGVMQASVTIANGATVSAAVDLGGHMLCGIQMPAAFTGTTISFQASTTPPDYSRDASGPAPTFVPVHDAAGAAVTYTVGASRYVAFDPAIFSGIRQLKIVSSLTELAARTLIVALRPAS